jgi:hypothetical protein
MDFVARLHPSDLLHADCQLCWLAIGPILVPAVGPVLGYLGGLICLQSVLEAF